MIVYVSLLARFIIKGYDRLFMSQAVFVMCIQVICISCINMHLSHNLPNYFRIAIDDVSMADTLPSLHGPDKTTGYFL